VQHQPTGNLTSITFFHTQAGDSHCDATVPGPPLFVGNSSLPWPRWSICSQVSLEVFLEVVKVSKISQRTIWPCGCQNIVTFSISSLILNVGPKRDILNTVFFARKKSIIFKTPRSFLHAVLARYFYVAMSISTISLVCCFSQFHHFVEIQRLTRT